MQAGAGAGASSSFTAAELAAYADVASHPLTRREAAGAFERVVDGLYGRFVAARGRMEGEMERLDVGGTLPEVAAFGGFQGFRDAMQAAHAAHAANAPSDGADADADAAADAAAPSPFEALVVAEGPAVRLAFAEMLDSAVAKLAAEAARQARRRARYAALLGDYYYRSDHLDVAWEEVRD